MLAIYIYIYIYMYVLLLSMKYHVRLYNCGALFRYSTSLTDSELKMSKGARRELLKAWWNEFLLEV